MQEYLSGKAEWEGTQDFLAKFPRRVAWFALGQVSRQLPVVPYLEASQV